MPLSRVVIVVALIALVILVPVLNQRFSPGSATEITLQQPELRIIRPSILASGSLAHEDEVTLTPEVIGRVTAVLVEEGDSVDAGELVLKIDSETFVAQVEQNQASVRLQAIDIERAELRVINLKRQRDRSEQLFERSLLDENAYESVDHEYRVAEVDLRSSRERLVQSRALLQQFSDQLEKTQVRAPISGVVTSLDIEPGETAIISTTNIPGSGLMTIADPGSIITEVFVDEADVAGIQVGQSAEIVAIAYADQPLQGIVEFVANTAKLELNRRGLSFLVRIRITDSNGIKLRPGMSCRAAIFTESEDEVLSLPIAALITEEEAASRAEKNYVFVARAGIAHKLEVTVGASDDEFQEIVSGLTEQDYVVTGPPRRLRRLKEGEEVRSDAGE